MRISSLTRMWSLVNVSMWHVGRGWWVIWNKHAPSTDKWCHYVTAHSRGFYWTFSYKWKQAQRGRLWFVRAIIVCLMSLYLTILAVSSMEIKNTQYGICVIDNKHVNFVFLLAILNLKVLHLFLKFEHKQMCLICSNLKDCVTFSRVVYFSRTTSVPILKIHLNMKNGTVNPKPITLFYDPLKNIHSL